MSNINALYTALSALQAAQAGIDTASHNVTNVSTEGYTRQRVDVRTRRPHTFPYGQVGNGVEIVDITRARDAHLDARVRAGSAALSGLEIRSEVLGRLETVMNEPQAGISTALSNLWSSFEEWSLDPPAGAPRLNVMTALENLTSEIRIVNEGWTATAAHAADELSARVDEVNGLLRQVAELNQAVLESTTQTGTPNDLLDRRDVVLDRLSELAGVTVTPEKHGTVRVSLNGMQLVGADQVSLLSVDTATAVITHDSGVEINASGVLGGYQTVITTDLPAFKAQLDSFVEELAANLNTRHAAGFHETGAGGDLLTYTLGNAAETVAVAVTDPSQLASASTAGPPFPAFDATNADNLAALQFDEVAASGTASLDELHRTLVVDVGGATAAASAAAASQAAVQGSADLARLGQHGVSIDEEMVELLHYQRAYEAAARVMTAVDEALEHLINRTGIVGR